MSTQAKSRINAMERRIAKQRPKGTVLVIETGGQYSRDGRHYDALAALKTAENLRGARVMVIELEPTSWAPN